MTAPLYFVNYAKQVTSALAGDPLDLEDSLKTVSFDFQYLNSQVSDLKHLLGVLKNDRSDNVNFYRELLRRYERKDLSEVGNIWSMAIGASLPTEVENINIKIAIDGLLALNAKLSIDCTPEEAKVLSAYLGILLILESAYPSLSADQKTTLDQLPKVMAQDLEAVSDKDFMKVYWQGIIDIYQKIQTNLYQAVQPLDDQITAVEGEIQEAEVMNQLVSQLNNTFRNFVNVTWSIEPSYIDGLKTLDDPSLFSLVRSLEGITQLYFDLPQVYDGVSPTAQNMLNEIIQVFDNALITPTVRLGDIIALCCLQHIACIEKVKNPSVTGDNLQQLIREFSGKYNLSGLTAFKRRLDIAIEAIGRGELVTYMGRNVFDNQWTPSNEFISGINKLVIKERKFSLSDYTNLIAPVYKNYFDKYQKYLTDQNLTTNNLKASLDSLNIDKQSFYPVMVEAQDNFVVIMPLQTSLASLMLDKYLPEQEFYLQSLGVQLSFSDKAAGYINRILDFCRRFQTADVYYAGTIYFRQMNFAGIKNAIRNAQIVLSDEMTRCKADIARAQLAIKTIQDIQSEINADTALSTVQKQELSKVMSGYKNNFESLIKNLCILYNLISGLTVKAKEKPTETYEAFDVVGPEGWARLLSLYESFVIDGGQVGIFYGGEQTVQTVLESAHHGYSDFNQNQQLALQLEIASVQQEWTIISTSLGIINQIYSGITRKIKQ